MAQQDNEKSTAVITPSQLQDSDIENTLSPSDSLPDFQPPDGGLTAWTQVLASTLVNMLSWGYPSAFGVFQLYYRDTLDLPDAQISWIGSVQTFLAFMTCTFSGRLADAGYIRSTTSAGAFLVVFGTFMTSLATEYWQIFLAQGLCTGLGLGVMFMPPLALIGAYFKEKRSYALAVAATGTGLGSMIFPAMIQYLIPSVGFPWAVRCAGFVALFISVVSISMLRPVLAPRTAGPLVEWNAFKEVSYVLYALGAFLFFWALYFGLFFINTYARNVANFSTTDSVQLIMILNGLSIPSRPMMGYIADKWTGAVNAYALSSLLLGIVSFLWIPVKTRVGMYVFTVFFGFVSGAAQGVYVGSLASLTKDPRKMGTRFGMCCSIVAFATLAGPPTAGAIIDQSGGDFLWAQIWAALVIVLGAVALAASRCSVVGFNWKAKI